MSTEGEARSPIRLLQATAFVATFDWFAMPPMLVAITVDMDAQLSGVVRAAGAYFLAHCRRTTSRVGRCTT